MLIGLTGKKFSGKTTIAKFLTENYDFKEYAFADSLKKACINIFGLTEEQVYGKNKETLRIIDEYWNTTPRVIMQTLGTLIRNLNDSPETNLNNLKDIWIKQVHRKIIESKNKNHKNIVVSDIRYNDEALMIKKLGGIIIKIDKQDDKHESENQELKLGEVDIIISNDGTIDNLLEKIKQVIDHYNSTIIPL